MIKLYAPPFNANRWRFPFTVVLIAEMVTLMAFQTSVSIIPFFLQQDLGIVGDAELKGWISILAVLPAVSMAIWAPIWGSLADNFGKRIMLLRAMFGGSVVIFVMTFVAGPTQLLILRVIQGSLTGSVAAATVLVAAMVPRQSAGMALGILQVGVYIGGAIGPAFGAFLFATVGGRGNFLITSFILLLASLVTLIFVPEPPLAVKEPKAKRKLIDFSPLKENKFILFLILVNLFSQTAFNVNVPIIGVYIQFLSPHLDLGQVAAVTGLVVGVSTALAALGAVIAGAVGKKFNFYHILIVCFIGSAALVVLQGLVSNWQTLLWLRIINSIFLGGVMPSINAMLVFTASKEKQGAVFGLSSSASTAGSALGPALGGIVANLAYGLLGFRYTFFVSGVILILLTIAVLQHKRQGDKAGEG
ncbi:MAG: MFS transporter [Spirochaetaceae bacterium]|nr:MFS transporter [Spirochaetaceae bacterium]